MASESTSSRVQIVVAIIGLLGVLGGAVIANWDKIVPPSKNGPLREMQVRVDAPMSVEVGASTPIGVEVLSGPDSPIAAATVKLDVGGGSFSRSGGLVSQGQTNPHGFYADSWTSPPGSGGINYLVTVSVSKEGFEPASRRIQILVRP
jgi:hypothetical protein